MVNEDLENSDIQDAKATMIPDKNMLYLTFVKPLKSKGENTISIGEEGGLHYFSDGPSHLKQTGSFVWLTKDEEPMDFNKLLKK